jgi:hypothetical protein
VQYVPGKIPDDPEDSAAKNKLQSEKNLMIMVKDKPLL